MKKTILIAPFEGPFAAALADEARRAGWSVLLARPDLASAPKRAAGADGQPDPAELAALPWNPSSYISTSALFLSGRNAVGELDAAVLLSEGGQARADLIGGKPGEIEAALQRAALGPAFFVREALRAFEARRGGSLVFVDREGEAQASPQASSPAGSLATGAFRGLAEGVFAMSREASFEAFGVLDRTGNNEELARFILKLLEVKKSGKSGRWLRFTGKSGLFGKFQERT